MLMIQPRKLRHLKGALIGLLPVALLTIFALQVRPIVHADSGGLAFAQIATHPNASQSGYANGAGGCVQAFCPAGQDIFELEVTSDDKLIAGYGDWGGNSDSWGVPAGRVGVVPYDLQGWYLG